MRNRATSLLVVAAGLLAIFLVGCSDDTAPTSITSSVIPTPTVVPTTTPIPSSTQSQSAPELTPTATRLPTATPTRLPTATPTPAAHPTTAPTVTLPDAAKNPIIFSELPWESAQLQNRIAQFIIEHGYGHPTGVVSGSIPILFEGLLRGDIDVTMEVLLPGQKLEWDQARNEGQVLGVGQRPGFDWQSAFVIPAYLQEQYPDLDSVEDLKDPQFKRLFQNAESGDKARLVSCVINWGCERINAAQIAGYGLEDHIHVVNPTSEPALNADLYAAYERGEPWLGYQWSTSDPALKLNLVRLEEPAYSDECWSTTKACAYEGNTILIAVNPGLPLNAPDVVAMLGKWNFDIDAYAAVVKWQGATGVTDPTSAAIWWLENNLETWSDWVTDDAAANVQAALDRGATAAGWSRVITTPIPRATPTPEPTPTPTATPRTVSTPAPTATPRPISTPTSTATPRPEPTPTTTATPIRPGKFSEFNGASAATWRRMHEGGQIISCYEGLALPRDSFCLSEGFRFTSDYSEILGAKFLVAHLPDGDALVLQGNSTFRSGGDIRLGWITFEDRVITHLDFNASQSSTPVATATSVSEGADSVCHVGLIIRPGESCTYPGTSTEFSVDSSGTGRFLFFTAGTGIDARNATINGVTYNFKASKQADGTWIIEVAGDS